ncbi:MAG: SAM-dependent methyltransferase [Acidobacteriia bacterium]|nr:SAM-dependent methyltransferase [Terriglobia bacterium]
MPGTPYLVPCLLLFAGSGCAALIYEIVWFQLLELVIGSSGISLGLLLAAYMGGLCLGSALLARLVSRLYHPLRVYALLELGIAIFGIAALFLTPLVGRAYIAGPVSGTAGLVVRGVVAAVCLLPPTFLMGASLPAMSRWVETTPKGISWLGHLYSANVAGAVTGCLLAGFYLLRFYDLGVATYVAAGINVAVAGLALVLAARAPRQSASAPEVPSGVFNRVEHAPGASLVFVAIALSGLAALGAEVVWTRLLSLLLGGTVYTFSIILAVFLLGLWAGSAAGASLARRVSQPRWALAACQILLAAAIAWTAFTLASVLPYWPVDPLLSVSPWFNFDLDLTRCLRAIFPATLLWGASFPLALASAAAGGEDPARLSGSVYAVNTAGSIVGALMFSLVLIPGIGTRASQEVLIWVAAVGALMALAGASLGVRNRTPMWMAGGAAVATLLLAWGLTTTVADMPWQAIAYGRRVAPILRGLSVASDKLAGPLFVGEGIDSSVVITQRGDQRFFYVSGKSEASSAPVDMRLQRMMAHVPALLHTPLPAGPRSVLVVGFGAGVTAGSFVPYPEVETIVICELESLIPPASDEFFGKENNNVLRDHRTRMVYDDARHYIATTHQKFDIITTDPIHPWVKGTSTLYSKEYYELAKSHLNPGGIAAQWLPIYESDQETVKTELATFFSVFPDATVWSNYLQDANPEDNGYDLVLVGRQDSSLVNIDALQQRLDQPAHRGVAASLAEVGFHSAVELLASYTGRGSDLAPMLVGTPVTNDLNLRLQYLAGLGLNSVTAPRIYSDILAYRKFPDGLLAGSDAQMNALRAVLGRSHRTF